MTNMNMNKLTVKIGELCGGQSVADVVGASFNVMMSALNTVPDKRILSATAKTMRDMASQLEDIAASKHH